MVKPVVFQVTGYQNSGKTTFTLKLIELLKNHGLQTVTIKHHGHGGKPAAFMEKDSGKHLVSGARASLVEGEGRLILQAELGECSLEKQIELMMSFQPDVILIEGYKFKEYPKVLLLRDDCDLVLLAKVANISGVVYWKEEMKGSIEEIWTGPNFHIYDETAINWTARLIENACSSNR